MSKLKKTLILGVFVAACALLLTACPQTNTPTAASNAAHNEQVVSGNVLQNMLRTQPPPVRPYSQLRQNLVEIETAQMDGAQSTSFFFNQGVTDPVSSCPSIGFPIPVTDQLTNPSQIIQDRGNRNGGNAVIPQIDPNGVYGGNGTGTYAMCVDAQGRPYPYYWEGFVAAVPAPATWNKATHAVELVGPPSFNFTAHKK